MKASEAIAKLQELIKKHGDKTVVVECSDYITEASRIRYALANDKSEIGFIFEE